MTNQLKTALFAGVIAFSAQIAQAQCTLVLPFDNGSSTLSATNQSIIRELIANDPGAVVSITGHANAVGSAAANNAISQARIQAVVNYLQSIDTTGISVASAQAVATSDPIPGTSPQDGVNRRVQIDVPSCDPQEYASLRGTQIVDPANGLGGLGEVGIGAAALGGLLIIGLSEDSDSSTSTTN